MALVNGSDYDHIDLHPVSGGDVTRHMLKDAQARQDVSDLKSAITLVGGGEMLLPWNAGKRIATNVTTVDYNNPASSGTYSCAVIDCAAGDVFTITGRNSSTVYALWCWCTANGTKITAPSTTQDVQNQEIKAPTGAEKLIMNVMEADPHSVVKGKVVDSNRSAMNNAIIPCANLMSFIPKNNQDDDIDVTWNSEGVCAEVVGSKASLFTHYIFNNACNLPNGIIAGETYRIIFYAENVYFRIVVFDATGASSAILNKNGYINEPLTVPTTAIGMQIMLRVTANVATNETVYPFIFTEKTEIEKNAFASNFLAEAKDENILTSLFPENKTSGEVTFVWNYVDMSCAVSGTATSNRFVDIYYNKTSLPNNVQANGKYIIACDSDYVKLRVIWYDSEGTDALLAMTNGKEPLSITIPAAAVGLAIRLYVNTLNVSINETVYAYMYADMSTFAKDLYKLQIGAGDSDTGGIVASEAKLLSVGNSFMGGAVYNSGSFNHMASYKNTVYGQFAISLNIPEENVTNIMHSSCGIIRKSDNINLADIIKGTDLSAFDYLLTMMSGTDMASYPIGTVDATADDGTIAGAVVGVIEYLNASNGMCKLIFLSTPPYSSNLTISGANTFTGLYGNGSSLADLDNVMFALAKKYHFTYISWQDNPMSYHYMDFADYIGDNQGSRHAKSDATYRAMGEYAALQMRAVNSPIALKLIAGLT